MAAERTLVYFTSDVHLGLTTADPAEREERFVGWLKSLPRDAKALYLLGDIWDFWYEYRDVVPKEGIRVIAQLIDLMDHGVEVWFMPGNHDIWCYSFFESLGIRKIRQPYRVEFGGRRFCLGHGDGLKDARRRYRFMLWVFNNRFLQALFSTLHPRLAFSMARRWSTNNRYTHTPYEWKGSDEALVRFAEEEIAAGRKADYFIFGHYHVQAAEKLSDGSKLFVIDSWLKGGTPCLIFDGKSLKACR
ncbi:MAG: UDP-2,3-diacylglucosamine diphosphatase [Bacteroidales bacterium]|nr:UDP-2,3-diacylglucosamine diphosphatase [Bacteroidales bacterium]